MPASDAGRRLGLWRPLPRRDDVRPEPPLSEQQVAPNPRKRRAIPDRAKQFVWNRDGGRCVQCGSTDKLGYDHIIPLSRGGSNTARNLQLLCEECNRRKGNFIT